MASIHHPIGATKLWGDDIKILANSQRRFPDGATILELSVGCGMSSVTVRTKLVKLVRLDLMDVKNEQNTKVYAITDIGRTVLAGILLRKVADNPFDYERPGWNRRWDVLQEMLK